MNKKGEYPKRAPVGVYDDRILCGSCESQFGEWDKYAQEVLEEPPKHATPIMYGSQTVGYEIKEYKYDLLKLFFISVLWRASVSEAPFYERVSLGPYEAHAKRLIAHRDPGLSGDFAVTIARFDHLLGGTILDPHTDRFSGINYCRFYLGGYVAYMKVDKRRPPEPHPHFCLKPNEPLKIIARNLEKSVELKLIKRAIAANKSLHPIGPNCRLRVSCSLGVSYAHSCR
jgi:hypothetical protein